MTEAVFRETTAELRTQSVPLSHLSLELGHLYMEDFEAGPERLREHFAEDEVLFFTPGDANALADALLATARDPEAARTRAEAALRRAGAYAWGTNAARYVRLLDDLSGPR